MIIPASYVQKRMAYIVPGFPLWVPVMLGLVISAVIIYSIITYKRKRSVQMIKPVPITYAGGSIDPQGYSSFHPQTQEYIAQPSYYSLPLVTKQDNGQTDWSKNKASGTMLSIPPAYVRA
ncbi:hypothetical protein BABINDRAFT_160424 [Babjeviella inositovora NRRL Y-12698]|uniref:Uncharacterized protein n=1 Tax=Babjeviella inositovora NRRL Y-12698 TaxID=984486 RepID=A0A1E3QTI2_9ASCO|nr:uncharacterized protein BABINDRAFT_160424 [Babjeviella inositovora NRRL Y-12698]ODQ81003.1 hypothetical protein BABINDRAFT_160424 [Babjeviella inositovora NRRL Y-12698]